MGLVAQEPPNNYTLRIDSNVVIADSGSTYHSKHHAMGITNIKISFYCDSIHTGDGTITHTKIIGNIPMVQHYKRVLRVQSCMWKKFMHTPSGRFIPFSMSKLLNEGWTLNGYENELFLRKGEN